MFRAVVVSIVLALVAGQNAAWLCRVWCGPHEAATIGCHHQDPTTFASMTGSDNCHNEALGALAFVREDGRRGVSDPNGQHAVVFSGLRSAPPPIENRPSGTPRQQLLPVERPPVVTLRI